MCIASQSGIKMTTLSLPANYDFINRSTIREIENLCLENSFVRRIKGYIQFRRLLGCSKRAIALNDDIGERLFEFSYDDIVRYQAVIQTTLENLEPLHQQCQICSDSACKKEFIGKFYTPFIASLKDTNEIIRKSYHFDGDRLFADAEYKERTEILAAFSDIWDYESSEGEKRCVFEHNAQL